MFIQSMGCVVRHGPCRFHPTYQTKQMAATAICRCPQMAQSYIFLLNLQM